MSTNALRYDMSRRALEGSLFQAQQIFTKPRIFVNTNDAKRNIHQHTKTKDRNGGPFEMPAPICLFGWDYVVHDAPLVEQKEKAGETLQGESRASWPALLSRRIAC